MSTAPGTVVVVVSAAVVAAAVTVVVVYPAHVACMLFTQQLRCFAGLNGLSQAAGNRWKKPWRWRVLLLKAMAQTV